MSLFEEDEADLIPEMPPKRPIKDDGLPRKKNKNNNKLKSGADVKKDSGTDDQVDVSVVKLKKSARQALRPERMFFKEQERKMYAEYFNRFRADIEERYGEFTTSHELLIDCLCYAIVRLERKSRLESWFGRFFDRVAPQDPLNQINNTLKSLGLLPEKKENKDVNAANEIKKILAADATESHKVDQKQLDYDTWLQEAQNRLPEIKIRTPEEIPTYLDNDMAFEDEEEII